MNLLGFAIYAAEQGSDCDNSKFCPIFYKSREYVLF